MPASLTVAGMSPSQDEWQILKEQAKIFLESGLLPAHVKTPQAAILIMIKGRELAIPPLYALSNIVVISGKPTANSELLQALIYRDHGDDALRFTETSDTQAVLSYKRRSWTKAERFVFSIDDAKRAGLLSNATWQKYPGAMLRARAISAVARLAFADSIGGLYTSEELGASVSVSSEGEIVVDALPEPEPRQPRDTYRPQPSTAEPIPMRQIAQTVTDESTGEITDAAPPPAATVAEEDKPAPSAWIVSLRGLVEQLAQFGVHEELPAGVISRGQARVIKAALIDTLAEAKRQAEESPL